MRNEFREYNEYREYEEGPFYPMEYSRSDLDKMYMKLFDYVEDIEEKIEKNKSTGMIDSEILDTFEKCRKQYYSLLGFWYKGDEAYLLQCKEILDDIKSCLLNISNAIKTPEEMKEEMKRKEEVKKALDEAKAALDGLKAL